MSDQQLALVTGTSSGIGLHTAVGLAAAGLRVVATMRDPGRADRLRAVAQENGVTLEVRALDVTDEAQATALVAELGRVDVLVNNAGRGSVATLEQLSTEDLRAQLEVNYVGVAVLTRLVLPGMRAAGRGRVVTVTSVGGAVGQPFSDAYCGAKFAVEGLMQSLAPVVARFGIGVCIVEPGAVASDFVSNVAGDLSGTATEDPYAGLLAAYLKRASGSFAGAQAAPDAARTVIEACLSPDPQFRWQTSDGARAFAGLSLGDLDGSRVLGATTTWLE
ncbi:SDR family oxidoreductase [Winogradskya consettensis]|uniref:Short-chain dehydrogenase/reductase n=1 Tax=Winogradskya consettensis TaxID=113560 RepID=A0A919SZV7_9ACTN|nr:SDR family NAD(P)-dependent oxidoreductase [Actinoplanes consettensis]GIM80088.1 short-chain dehydrogenase/reductase [Actinoplanes consettensis]